MDPSTDEIILTVISAAAAVLLWGRWYHVALFTGRRLSTLRERNTITTSPLISAALLLGFLVLYADREVRDSPFYLTQYMAMGAAIVGLAVQLTPTLGICARDDVVERRNYAAGIVLSGAILAFMFCYAGSNIGDGPGWWVVIFCSALALITFLLIWIAVELVGRVSEAVTVDRHIPTAIRFHSFLLSIGLIFGRAVAGDWVDYLSTIVDFIIFGSPALVFVVAEMARLRMRPPSGRGHGRGSSAETLDYFLAIGYFSIAVMYLIGLGWWM